VRIKPSNRTRRTHREPEKQKSPKALKPRGFSEPYQ
jgi:hypothetical protein